MKKYDDQELAKDILIMVDKKYTPKAVSNWAHQIHMKADETFTVVGREALLTLIAMDEGPEFELDEQDLKELAKTLLESKKNG